MVLLDPPHSAILFGCDSGIRDSRFEAADSEGSRSGSEAKRVSRVYLKFVGGFISRTSRQRIDKRPEFATKRRSVGPHEGLPGPLFQCTRFAVPICHLGAVGRMETMLAETMLADFRARAARVCGCTCAGFRGPDAGEKLPWPPPPGRSRTPDASLSCRVPG